MSGETKRVQFRAPHRLIDRTDALADVIGEDRTDILVTALREYLQAAAHDDALTQEIAAVGDRVAALDNVNTAHRTIESQILLERMFHAAFVSRYLSNPQPRQDFTKPQQFEIRDTSTPPER